MTSHYSKKELAILIGVPAVILTGAAGYYFYSRRQKDDTKPKASSAKKSQKSPVANTLLGKATALREKGNSLFKEGKYAEAAKFYSDAIELCMSEPDAARKPVDLSLFYQNRAAAYDKLVPEFDPYNRLYLCSLFKGDLKKVIEDCSQALKLNKKYLKAILRRAKAYEVSCDYEKALYDYTAGVVLENFQNDAHLASADVVLKGLAQKRAVALLEKRGSDYTVPISHTFVESYLSAFCEDPIMNKLPQGDEAINGSAAAVDNESAGDGLSGFLAVEHYLVTRQHDRVVPACTTIIEDPNSPSHREALLLRATFYLIQGRSDEATVDFEKLLTLLGDADDADIKKYKVNTLIKRGSLHMQRGDKETALVDFSLAEEVDNTNADLYHHRGQLMILVDDIDKSVRDFERATELRPDFAISVVQLGYARYRQAKAKQSYVELEKANRNFEAAVTEQFPKCAEGYALLAQSYAEQQNFEEALKMYEKAKSLAPNNANVYVHMGLLDLQSKGEPEGAVALMKKGLDVDPNCEFAYETLGTIEIQRGNTKEAIQHFDHAIKLARTELELTHLFTLREAAVMQVKVMTDFNIPTPSLIP